jgi:hypothetical protein
LKFETGWAKMEDPIAKYMVQVVEHLPSKHGALVQAQVLLKRKKKERKKKKGRKENGQMIRMDIPLKKKKRRHLNDN